MGILSDKDIENQYYDRELSNTTGKFVKHNDAYKEYRDKYKYDISRRPIEPKGWDSEIESEDELSL